MKSEGRSTGGCGNYMQGAVRSTITVPLQRRKEFGRTVDANRTKPCVTFRESVYCMHSGAERSIKCRGPGGKVHGVVGKGGGRRSAVFRGLVCVRVFGSRSISQRASSPLQLGAFNPRSGSRRCQIGGTSRRQEGTGGSTGAPPRNGDLGRGSDVRVAAEGRRLDGETPGSVHRGIERDGVERGRDSEGGREALEA